MTAIGQMLAGGRLTAAALQGIAPVGSVKAVNETVTSSTTPQNDDALWFPVAANSTYFFIALLVITGNSIGSGDLKGDFNWPSGATAMWWSFGYSPSSASPNSNHAENSPGSGNAHALGADGASLSGALLIGSITTGNTAGTLQWQWAQEVSSGTGTVEHAGSVLAGWLMSS